MMLNLADQYPKTKDFMLRHLDEFLEHPRDRELFDLAPIETPPNIPTDGMGKGYSTRLGMTGVEGCRINAPLFSCRRP